MELNEAGDYEQDIEDGSIIARFTDEGIIVDWFNNDADGTHDRTWFALWDDLYEQSLPGGHP